MQNNWTAHLVSFTPVLAAALTALATLLGTFIAVSFAWLKERSESNRRSQLAKEASDQATFWKEWYGLRTLVGLPGEAEGLHTRLREELDILADDLRRGMSKPLIPRSLIRRIFLLYRPLNQLGWLLRLPFYLLVLFVIPFAYQLPATVLGLQGYLFDSVASNPSVKLFLEPVFKTLEEALSKPPDHVTPDYLRGFITSTTVSLFTSLLLSFLILWFGLMCAYILATLFARAIALDIDRDRDIDAVSNWLIYKAKPKNPGK